MITRLKGHADLFAPDCRRGHAVVCGDLLARVLADSLAASDHYRPLLEHISVFGSEAALRQGVLAAHINKLYFHLAGSVFIALFEDDGTLT